MNGNDGIVWHLRVQEEHLGTVAVLRLEGRVYSATSAQLAEALARICTDPSTLPGAGRRAILDLTAVDYVNGEGLRLIEAAAGRCRSARAELIVCGLSPIVRTAFDLGGATAHLIIEPSREAALRRAAT